MERVRRSLFFGVVNVVVMCWEQECSHSHFQTGKGDEDVRWQKVWVQNEGHQMGLDYTQGDSLDPLLG